MEQLATPGTVRLTVDTLRLAEGYFEVRSLGLAPVKGLEQPIDIYELIGARPRRSRFHTAAARGLTEFVGRENELEALSQALARAAAGRGQVIAIVGEAGVGKSRLIWEVTHSQLLTRGPQLVMVFDTEVTLEEIDHWQVARRLAIGDRTGLENEPTLHAMRVGDFPD